MLRSKLSWLITNNIAQISQCRSFSRVVRMVPSRKDSENQRIGVKPLNPESSDIIAETITPRKRLLNIAIIGRPNTGKSTLFNRITNTNQAIVSDVPGTTRDRKEGKGTLAGLPVNVVDTGGLDDRGAVTKDIQDQVKLAIERADVILFMLDARAGVNMIDEHFAKWIRKKIGTSSESQTKTKEIIVLANKTEGAHLSNRVLDTIAEAYQLGLGDPIPISAAHGDGIADVSQALFEIAKKLDADLGDVDPITHTTPRTLEERLIQIAIMGRPNVGKSSLLNAILGEERVITGPVAGLTRDAIPVEWTYNGRQFRLVDTAGLTRIAPNENLLKKSPDERRIERERGSFGRIPRIALPGAEYMDPDEDPSQFSGQVSELALMSALNALKFAQVVLIVVEGSQGEFSKIDLQLATKCLEEGRALIVVANKRDIVALAGVTGKQYEEGVKQHCEANLQNFGDICVVSTSATENEGISRILKTIVTVHDAWSKRISTWLLNRWIRDTLVTAPKPRVGDKPLNVKYVTQIKARPPTFAMFCNTDKIPQSFERFLKSKLQRDFKLVGVPVRVIVRKAKGTKANPKLLKHGKQTRVGSGSHSRSRGVGPKNRSPTALFRLKKARSESRRRQKRIDKRRKRG